MVYGICKSLHFVLISILKCPNLLELGLYIEDDFILSIKKGKGTVVPWGFSHFSGKYLLLTSPAVKKKPWKIVSQTRNGDGLPSKSTLCLGAFTLKANFLNVLLPCPNVSQFHCISMTAFIDKCIPFKVCTVYTWDLLNECKNNSSHSNIHLFTQKNNFFQEVEVIYKIFHSGTLQSGHVIKYIHQHNSIFVPETVSTNVEMGPLVAPFLHRIKRDITSVG